MFLFSKRFPKYSVLSVFQVCVTVPHVHGSKLNLEIDLPIILGTVPLRKSCGNVNKLISASELQKLYSGHRSFVTIKQGTLSLKRIFGCKALLLVDKTVLFPIPYKW